MFAGHRAPEGSSNPVWQDFLNYGTVARGLQATHSQPPSHAPHETSAAGRQTESQHKNDEAAEHEEAAAPAGDFRHLLAASTDTDIHYHSPRTTQSTVQQLKSQREMFSQYLLQHAELATWQLT